MVGDWGLGSVRDKGMTTDSRLGISRRSVGIHKVKAMPIGENDIREIQARVAPLLGQKVWGAALGTGSFVTLEFGAVRPGQGPGTRDHGEWHLWIYCAAWRLEQEDAVLAASEDPRPKLEQAVTRLNGLALDVIEVRRPALEAIFQFEQGIALRVFPIFSEGFEHWMIYMPDGNVLTAGPGTSWNITPATTPGP